MTTHPQRREDHRTARLTRGSDGRHFEDLTLAHNRSVRVVRRDQLSDDTPQTSELLRHVAFDSRNPTPRY